MVVTVELPAGKTQVTVPVADPAHATITIYVNRMASKATMGR